MKKIKFVYFDVGGVLLLDYSGTNKWNQMKRDLGITEDLDNKFDTVWKKYRSRICIDCDVDTIIPELEKETGIKIDKNYSMLEDFVNRFEKNELVWKVAEDAKQNYQIGLLTNMYPRMLSCIKNKNLIPDIEYDSVVDSSIVGFQKPEDGIYEIAERMANCEPSEIFFVDNSSQHVDTAKNRGWQTMLYDPQDPEVSSRQLKKLLKIEE